VLGIFLFDTAVSRQDLGPTQPPIQLLTGALFLGVKQPKREADHSPLSSAEVKNAWSYTSDPQYAFILWCSVKAVWQHFYKWRNETSLGFLFEFWSPVIALGRVSTEPTLHSSMSWREANFTSTLHQALSTKDMSEQTQSACISVLEIQFVWIKRNREQLLGVVQKLGNLLQRTIRRCELHKKYRQDITQAAGWTCSD